MRSAEIGLRNRKEPIHCKSIVSDFAFILNNFTNKSALAAQLGKEKVKYFSYYIQFYFKLINNGRISATTEHIYLVIDWRTQPLISIALPLIEDHNRGLCFVR